MWSLLLFVLFSTLCSCLPLPGYQLGSTQRNAIGTGASSAVLGQYLYVVGGSSDEEHTSLSDPQLQFLFRDTRRYNLVSKEWTNVGVLPEQRAYHSLNSYQQQLYLFGGISRGSFFSNDLYQYNPVFDSWTVRTVSNKPSARAGHATAVMGNTMFMFGGIGASGTLNDVWTLNLMNPTVWVKLPVGANTPSARYLSSATTYNGMFCVFGGTADGIVGNNELVCLVDSVTGTWRVETAVSGSPPPPTFGSVTAQVGNTLLVHSGKFHVSLSSYDFSSRTWSTSISALAYPLDRHTGVYHGTTLFILGGVTNRRVLGVGPVGVWTQETRACEQAYTGVDCETPICKHDCHGIGRCIAPDLCECAQGFSGTQCTDYSCELCEVNLKTLNQPIFYPLAKSKALQCLRALKTRLSEIKDRLAKEGDLTSISQSTWEFEQNQARQLVETTQKVLALLS